MVEEIIKMTDELIKKRKIEKRSGWTFMIGGTLFLPPFKTKNEAIKSALHYWVEIGKDTIKKIEIYIK